MSDHEWNRRPGATPTGGPEDGSESLAPPVARGRTVRGWWVSHWMRGLSQLFDATRLAGGRALAQEGRILSLEAGLGLVSARVRAETLEAAPYRVHLSFATYSDAQWERIIHLLSERAIYAAQLMNNEMPEDIESVFRAASVSLFPTSLQELGAECTCSDWASTCKHRAAVCYALGEWLDRDPFLLFTLRGRTREEVIAALRTRRASQAAGEETQTRAAQSITTDPDTLPADPASFWGLDAAVGATRAPLAPAEDEAELLEVLGELPFLQDEETRKQLSAIYREVARRARDVANGRAEAEGENGHA